MPRRPIDPFAPSTRKRRVIPHEFVLEALDPYGPTTRAMFGSIAVYVADKVVFILRSRGDVDDGVWVAFEPTREAEALAALPNLTKILCIPNVRSWRKLAQSSDTFEDDVLSACRLLRGEDPPIGKLPVRQKSKLGESRRAPTKRRRCS